MITEISIFYSKLRIPACYPSHYQVPGQGLSVPLALFASGALNLPL
jgi:hypothetical protein